MCNSSVASAGTADLPVNAGAGAEREHQANEDFVATAAQAFSTTFAELSQKLPGAPIAPPPGLSLVRPRVHHAETISLDEVAGGVLRELAWGGRSTHGCTPIDVGPNTGVAGQHQEKPASFGKSRRIRARWAKRRAKEDGLISVQAPPPSWIPSTRFNEGAPLADAFSSSSTDSTAASSGDEREWSSGSTTSSPISKDVVELADLRDQLRQALEQE